MVKDVFSQITREHVLSAIEEVDKNGVRVGRHSSTYDLLHNEKKYPPKYLISLAAKYVTGKELAPEEFSGGIDTEAFKVLENLGFTILPKKSEFLTPKEFARQLDEYIRSLSEGYKIESWEFQGETDVAYGTPVGSWEHAGFLFENNDYSFIIRCIWNSDPSNDINYLVVESNNLEGQLANLALGNPDKFSNINGKITIFETFDMTVGYGRRARNEVKETYKLFGFENNIITSFYETEFNGDKILSDILKWAITREKVKEHLQKTDSITTGSYIHKNKFWLLKIYGDNWNIMGLKEHDQGHFNSHFNSFEKRPDFDNFSSIEIGDKGMAYDYSSQKAVLFLFEVTNSLHVDSSREEIFSFKITRLLNPAISLAQF